MSKITTKRISRNHLHLILLQLILQFQQLETIKKVQAKNLKRNLRKQRTGVVTSAKMEKTIIVNIERKVKHPVYGKYMKKSKSLVAHDEKNECAEGDTVKVMETRPLSKSKRWRLVEIIEKAK